MTLFINKHIRYCPRGAKNKMAVFCQSIFLPYTTSVRLTLLKLDKCKVVYGLNKRLFCLPDTPYTSISFLNFFFLKGVGKGVSSVR